MAGVSYALANFVDGGPILDLPIMTGADWGAQLNRGDSLSCKVDAHDDDVRALDLPSSTEPKKTVLLARNDADNILAWGIIDEREWDEDNQTLELTAGGVWSSYFGKTIIAPAAALTAPLTTLDAEGFPISNPALDTNLAGWTLGTIGKKLIEQRLAWPGAPTAFVLPPDEVGLAERNYLFPSFKSIGSALTDLTGVENGPDFAFDARRAPNGLNLEYVLRHSTVASPRIGSYVGAWSLSELTPLSKLKVVDSGDDLGSAAWMSAGRSSGAALVSRALNPALIALSGYPPIDIVDTSHSDVSIQQTLDDYAAELIGYGATLTRDVSFTVRADAGLALGQYRPGDTASIDPDPGHPYLRSSIPIRITSISGDEAGLDVKVGCVVLDA